MLSLYSILTVTSSLFSTSSTGNVLQFLLMHMYAHTDLDHLTLVAMTAALKAALRCQCVSLTSPAGSPTPAHPCSTFVCMCVMMINTFVLKVNRGLLCVWVCVSVYVYVRVWCVGEHVLASMWPCECVSAYLCASVVSMPRTLLAVSSMIVVYSSDILHLVPVVHQPLSVLVRSF